jgi:hypothetical protein
MCLEELDPQPKIPERIQGPCRFCGSEKDAVFIKPVRESATWWDDPHGWWYCTDCGKELLNPTDEQIEKGVQDLIEWKRKQDPDWK